MSTINSITIQGYLVSEPEVKQTQSGFNVLSTRLGCSRGDSNDVFYVSVSMYGKLIEEFRSQAHKGSEVIVSGGLSVRKFTDKNGNPREVLFVKATGSYVLPKTSRQTPQQQHPQSQPQPQYQAPAPQQQYQPEPQQNNYQVPVQAPQAGYPLTPQGYEPPFNKPYQPSYDNVGVMDDEDIPF